MNKENVIIFGDPVGRLLIGEKVNSDDNFVSVKNPNVVDVQDGGNGQMGIRFIPNCYLELFEDADNGCWHFPRATHTFNDVQVSQQAVDLYERVIKQYNETKLQMKESDGDDGDDGDDGKVVSLVE